VLDIISPCVTFNNSELSTKGYAWGKDHEEALHDIRYVPPAEEITVEYEAGETRDVVLHDGSIIHLKKLGNDYDPTDKHAAIKLLEEARDGKCFCTGLIYIDETRPTIVEQQRLVDTPLALLPPQQLRPPREALDKINAMFM
jgi:2-oxoglutarate ferredoxin oxidoreductase subunit beta